jgi:hypothetical protein
MLKDEVVTQFAADNWVHRQLCVVGGRRLATPCFVGPVFDARDASLARDPVESRRVGVAGGARDA